MQKATTFEHNGKVYEVRAIPTLNGWKVRIFVEGIPANGFIYWFVSRICGWFLAPVICQERDIERVL